MDFMNPIGWISDCRLEREKKQKFPFHFFQTLYVYATHKEAVQIISVKLALALRKLKSSLEYFVVYFPDEK